MSEQRRNRSPARKPPRDRPPLDRPALEEMALAYVARYATTQARLRGYLVRKLRERGWEGTGGDGTEGGGRGGEDLGPTDRAEEGAAEVVAALVERFTQLGYLDDGAWANMRSGALARRGYGARRIGQALRDAGVAEELCAEAGLDDEGERRAALVLARRRRFGPFATGGGLPDRPRREKQLAAMIRAGHRLDIARRIVDALDPREVEEWADSP